MKWGPCFIIAYRRRAGKLHGLEARCPFHLKPSKTGCRKTFDLPEDADQSVIDLHLNALKWWCNSAKSWDRQRDHRAALEDVMSVPMFEEHVLEARKIPGPKPATKDVKTDDKLDRELAKASKPRGGAERGGARGRGRGRARGRGGRALPHLAEDAPASSSSSSSD